MQLVNDRFDNWLKTQPPSSDNSNLPQVSTTNSVIGESNLTTVATTVMSSGHDKTYDEVFDDVSVSQSSQSLLPRPIQPSASNTSTAAVTQTTNAVTGSIP